MPENDDNRYPGGYIIYGFKARARPTGYEVVETGTGKHLAHVTPLKVGQVLCCAPGCGAAFVPGKKPVLDQDTYCPKCGKQAAARAAQARYRQRRRQAALEKA